MIHKFRKNPLAKDYVNENGKRELHLFDLDRTVLDSDHRLKYKPNGDLDMKKYRELQTFENIKKDSVLPLGHIMQEFIRDRKEVGIVTARKMIKADYIMLRDNFIKPNLICARDKIHLVKHLSHCVVEHFKMSDDEYKRIWFKHIKDSFSLEEYDIFMYDDNESVLQAASEEGFYAINAIHLNNIISGASNH